jgi:DNA polymerase-3 subunit beta
MKLITTQGDLAHALRTIAPAISTSNSHPILSCCLLAADGATMTVTGFNLDLGISVTVPAAVEAPGTVALPHRLLAGLVSRFEDGEVLTLSDGLLSACGASYGLAAMDAEDYPAMPVVKAPGAELSLSDGVRACLPCCSTDISKAMLSGIHMAAGYMEATDGHRLMRIPVALPDGIDLVLPASTMKLLQDRTVTVAAATGQAVIDAGDGITIYSRILDGKYPDVAALVPASFEHTITVDRHRFARCLERVALIAEAHNSVVKLTAGAGALAITAEADANNGKELITYEGTAAGSWAFNVHYLLDGLKAMRGNEAVLLSANSATTPVTLQPADKTGMTYLVMPVQIRE